MGESTVAILVVRLLAIPRQRFKRLKLQDRERERERQTDRQTDRDTEGERGPERSCSQHTRELISAYAPRIYTHAR